MNAAAAGGLQVRAAGSTGGPGWSSAASTRRPTKQMLLVLDRPVTEEAMSTSCLGNGATLHLAVIVLPETEENARVRSGC